MTRWALAGAMILGCVSAAHAKLEIQNIQAVYGDLGPVRPSMEIYPLDEVVFRFTVANAGVNTDGKTDASITLRLTAANEKELVHQTSPLTVQPALGTQSFPAYARLNMGATVAPGEYTLTVTITDRLAKPRPESAEFERKLTVKESTFAIIAPRFFYDPEGRVPAPAGGVVGQALFIRMKVIGFDKVTGQVDTTMNLQILDTDGKEQMPKPLLGSAKKDDADVVKRLNNVMLTGGIVLNRPGKFTLRVTVTDNLGKKTTKFETPIQVNAL